MSTLVAAIVARLGERGGETALNGEEERLSFEAIDRASAEIASGLRARGIGLGERVAVGFPNSAELVAAILAVLRSGAALVPLNPAYPGDEAGYIVGDSAPALILTHAVQAAALREVGCGTTILTTTDELRATVASDPAPKAEDPALMIYTSGTTGRPKGAVLSHGALLSNLTTMADVWRWTARDRLLLTLPCFHLHGLGLGILGSFLAGSSVVLFLAGYWVFDRLRDSFAEAV